MGEGIKSQEDKEFTTSLGHWTGDANWDPGPIEGWTGLAKFILPVSPGIKTIQLASPNLITPTNKQVDFVTYALFPSPYAAINRRLIITDGVYSFIRPWSYQQFPDEWVSVALSAYLPPDWNKTNITIFIDIQMAPLGVTGIAYVDRVSLTWQPKRHYLMMVGVG